MTVPEEGSILVRVDSSAVLAQLAATLVRVEVDSPHDVVRRGLRALVQGLFLHRAVLRHAGSGASISVGGGVRHLVGAPAAPGGIPPVVQLAVRGLGGRELATLSVVGAGAEALPTLRTAAAVFGLALGGLLDAGVDLPTPRMALTSCSPLLVDALLDGLEADREALADALHDGAVQDLLVARYAVDAAIRTGDARAARDAVQCALVGLRRMLWHMRPRGRDDLPAALAALSERLVEAGLRPLLMRLGPGAEALTGASATATYRLVQALALAPTSGGGALRVGLDRSAGTVVLQVDGAPELMDLDRWHRRALALGGELSGAPGRLRLTLPAPPALPVTGPGPAALSMPFSSTPRSTPSQEALP